MSFIAYTHRTIPYINPTQMADNIERPSEELEAGPYESLSLPEELQKVNSLYTTFIQTRYNTNNQGIPEAVQDLQKVLELAGKKTNNLLNSRACVLHVWNELHDGVRSREVLNPGDDNKNLLFTLWHDMNPMGAGVSKVLLYAQCDKPSTVLSRPCLEWILHCILAQCVCAWNTDPLEFLPVKDFEQGKNNTIRMPPHGNSIIRLPSLTKSKKQNPLITDIIWFSEAPKYHRRSNKPLLGNHNYYIHRPEGEHAKVYFTTTSNGELSRLFLVLGNKEKLKNISDLCLSKGGDDLNIIRDTLFSFMRMVLTDGETFLKSIAGEIHEAKYHGMKSPGSRSIEFLYLAEDYLREMTTVMETAINLLSRFLERAEVTSHDEPQTAVRTGVLQEQNNSPHPEPQSRPGSQEGETLPEHNHPQHNSNSPAQFDEDLKHLCWVSGILQKEASAARQILFEQITLRQAGQAKVLTILASIYVPMSFVTGYFSMNFKEVSFSDMKLSTPPKITLYWKIAVPLVGVTILFPLVGPLIIGKAMRWVTKIWPAFQQTIFTAALFNVLGLVLYIINLLDSSYYSWYPFLLFLSLRILQGSLHLLKAIVKRPAGSTVKALLKTKKYEAYTLFGLIQFFCIDMIGIFEIEIVAGVVYFSWRFFLLLWWLREILRNMKPGLSTKKKIRLIFNGEVVSQPDVPHHFSKLYNSVSAFLKRRK